MNVVHRAREYFRLADRRERLVNIVVAVACAGGVFAWSGPEQFTAELFFPVFDGVARVVASVPLALLAGAAALLRRFRPVLLMLVGLLTWLLVSSVVVVVFALFAMGAFESRRWRVLVATVATLLLVGLPYWRLGGFDATIPISTAICLVPTLLGLWAGTRHTLVANLRERASRLEWEQQLREERARSEERTRIAREMHDLVAHRVNLIVLHAATAEVAEDAERLELARQIRSIGRTALDELRQLLGVLRLGEAPLAPQATLEDLPALLAQSQATGMDVRVRREGTTRELPAIIEQASYRVVQEALTNVHKHAGNAATTIRLVHQPAAFQVIVTNEPTPRREPDLALPSSGYGLVGLTERIRLIGGELTATRTDGGGFEVAATMPLTAGKSA